MGRFALRKQDKIKAHFEPHGDEMLNLLLDGNDIGLTCRVESLFDKYYRYCKIIEQ